MFQEVAVVLMLNVSQRSKKGLMKLHGDPSITYRILSAACTFINSGSISASSALSFALSVTTCRGSGGGQFLTDTWSFTTGKEDVLSHNTSKEKWHARAILHMSTSSRSASNTTPTSKWHRDANMGFHTRMLCSWYSSSFHCPT